MKPAGANNSWSMDFDSGSLLDSWQVLVLTTVNDFTRESLTIAVDLDQFLAKRDAPKSILANNGQELVWKAKGRWAYGLLIRLGFSRRGKSTHF